MCCVGGWEGSPHPAAGARGSPVDGDAPQVRACSGLGHPVPCLLIHAHTLILCTRMLTHTLCTLTLHTLYSSVWHTLLHTHSHVHTLMSHVH